MTSRVLSRDYRLKANSPSGTIADQDSFTYDSSSRMLTGISGRYSNTVTNTFDNAGRLSTESLTIGGQTYTVTSEYDLRSQRKKVTYPNSSTWERTYTARRQLYETKYNGSTVDTRAHDDGGRLDTSTYANGVVADYNWRADNLLADIGFSHPVGVAANRRIGTYTYAWDANKNKTKETITGQIPGYSFDTTLGTDPDGYDDENRLTYFKRQSTTNPQTWDLSLVGDWNSWSNFGTAQSRTHGPAHEILTAGSAPNNAFSHDVKGNMTDIPSNILSPARKQFWDFDNQLTGVDTTGDSTPEVTYEYDVLHRRVARIEGSNSKVYVHSGNQIIADYNRGSAANTTPAFRYVWGDYIDEPIVRQTGSTTILYYHRNQQYSTVALTNTSGEVVERYGYTAYGQMTVMNYLGNVRSWSDWSNRFTFTGREWDDTIKLFHFRARWYEPVAGRFVSRDPLGYVDGMGLSRNYFVLFGADPSGFGHIGQIEDESLQYSCNCGWIDWNHAGLKGEQVFENSPYMHVWNQILNHTGLQSLQGDGFLVKTHLQDRLVDSFGHYWVKNGLGRNDRKSVAMAIMQDASMRFEASQDTLGHTIGAFILGRQGSCFALEDLSSDLIHIYRVLNNLSYNDIVRICEVQTDKETNRKLFNQMQKRTGIIQFAGTI